jgi:predicted nucleic acid-binding protein
VIYFDTAYIARLYLQDPGWQQVRTLAATDHVACCLHGRAETVAAFHRKFREGVINHQELGVLLQQLQSDCQANAFQWLSLSASVVDRLMNIYARLPQTVPLRAADGLHLACAAENGFKVVYSNDGHLLAAAIHFGLRGIKVI